MGEFTDGFFGVGIDDGGLGFGDCFECGDLTVEESCRFAEGFESDAFGVYAVELCEGLYCILPPGRARLLVMWSRWLAGGLLEPQSRDVQCFPLLSAHAWHRWVGEMPPVEELHDVECCSNHAVIFAETVRLGNWYIGVSQCPDNLVLALNFMSCLREQLARGLLAQNDLLAISGSKKVGRV